MRPCADSTRPSRAGLMDGRAATAHTDERVHAPVASRQCPGDSQGPSKYRPSSASSSTWEAATGSVPRRGQAARPRRPLCRRPVRQGRLDVRGSRRRPATGPHAADARRRAGDERAPRRRTAAEGRGRVTASRERPLAGGSAPFASWPAALARRHSAQEDHGSAGALSENLGRCGSGPPWRAAAASRGSAIRYCAGPARFAGPPVGRPGRPPTRPTAVRTQDERSRLRQRLFVDAGDVTVTGPGACDQRR